MNVPCEDCGERPGRLHGVATWICDPCLRARHRLDEAPAHGITRPTADELRHAEQLLARALPFTP